MPSSSLSLILLAPGIFLVTLGFAAGLVGVGVAAVVAHLLPFAPCRCPFCRHENQVLDTASGFWCESCGSYVKTAEE